MTVKEYIDELSATTKVATNLCVMGAKTEDGKRLNCAHCPMQKAEGKSCTVTQLIDIKRTLQYAVDNSIHGITEETAIHDPMVVILIKRAVILGYSVYTLRECDDSYVQYKNLLKIDAYK